jgi:TRAP-type uncharacterized transport system substrate-binding protein
MNNIYIFLFIIVIIFYIYLILNNKKNITEGFYTFYLPFYDNHVNNSIKKLQQYNQPYFKDIFDYNTFKIGYTINFNNIDVYIKLLSKLIMEKSNKIKIELSQYTSNLDMINSLNKNQIALANVSAIITNNLYENNQKNLNIRYICNTFKMYIFIIVKKSIGIETFSSIKNKTKIGITNIKSNCYQTFIKLINFLNLKENIDFIFIFKNNNTEILDAINNDKIDIAIVESTFPSNSLNLFFTENYSQNYILLPIDTISNKIYEENIYLDQSIIDLNDIPTFLPKKINNKYYHQFNPDFNILSVQYYLLTNQENDNKIVYQIMNILKKNFPLFNNLPEFKYNILSKFSVGFYNKIIPIQESNFAIKYRYDNGFYTNTNSEICKYYVGYNNCNEESLKNYSYIQ